MCKNCSCKNYYKCSIVGYTPIGFCCTFCINYTTELTCLTCNSSVETEEIEEE